MSDDRSIPRLKLLKNLGFNPRTIIDIGAYKGNWSRMVYGIWPTANILMIEANEDHKSSLGATLGTLGFEIALLGEKKKKAVNFFTTTNPISTGNSIYKEQTLFFDNCEVRILPMTTLDEVVKKRKLVNIDFVKIDTQGSEIDILTGGKKAVQQAEFILLETSVLEYNLGSPTIFEAISRMKKLGFEIFDITEVNYLPTGEMLQVDILFARKDSRFIKRGRLI